MKTTIKEIRNAKGVDITNYTTKQIDELYKKEGWFQEIAWAPCIYGVGAIIYEGMKTHTWYKITRRTTAMFSI